MNKQKIVIKMAVSRLIVDIIPYRMSSFVLISIFRFFIYAISAYICIKYSVTVIFFSVKQPKT